MPDTPKKTRPGYFGLKKLLAGILFLSLFSVPGIALKNLTLEQIYAKDEFKGRSLDEVQWLADGRALSFLQKDGENGKSVLWKYDLKSRKRIRLVGPDDVKVKGEKDAEDPISLEKYQWSPAGSEILFVHKQDYYLFSLPEPRKLVRLTEDGEEKKDPQFSADGGHIAYVKDFNLCLLDVRTKEVRRLTEQGSAERLVGTFDWVYEEEFSIHQGFAWAPDGKHIAYFELDTSPEPQFPIVDFLEVHNIVKWQRYPLAGDKNAVVRVGVVSIENPGTVWMDTGPDADVYIPRIRWLPDGETLSIERLNRAQNRLELLLADIGTGKSRVVLTERETQGWLYANDNLAFLKDGKGIIWSSSMDGFPHLYLYDREGKLVRQLTRGAWQVDSLQGVDEKKGLLYFTAREKSIRETHLYRVSLDGTGLQRLSAENGIHEIRMSPDARFYLDTYSNVRTPPRAVLHSSDGKIIDILERNEMKNLIGEYALSAPEFLEFQTEDGTTLDAFMIKPPDFDPTKAYPLFIYIYGEPAGQTVLDRWGGKTYLWHLMLAQQGYIVMSIDPRGTPAPRGREWRKCIYRKVGIMAPADHAAAVKALMAQKPYLDASRVGIWGWSGGGQMTLNAMFKYPDLYKTGMAVAFVSDQRLYDTIYQERFMGLTKDNEEGYRDGSPVNFAKDLKGNLLIVHGTGDDNVHYQNFERLVNELIANNKPFTMMAYPNRSHGIYEGKGTTLHLYETLTNFLNRDMPPGPRAAK